MDPLIQRVTGMRTTCCLSIYSGTVLNGGREFGAYLQPCPGEDIAVVYQELPPIHRHSGPNPEVLRPKALADSWRVARPQRLPVLHQGLKWKDCSSNMLMCRTFHMHI